MTLGELLDELRDGVLRDTSDRVGGDSDQLWSDARLCRYIDEAQRRFAKKSLCLRDRTDLTTVAFQRDYSLPDSVFAVLSARFYGNCSYVEGVLTLNTGVAPGTAFVYPDSADLGRGGHSQFDTYVAPDTRYFDVNNLSVLPPSKPMAYDTDEYIAETNGVSGTMTMRLYPIPDVKHGGCLVNVRMVRMPTARLTSQDVTVTPEIPCEYHLHLLDYAAYLALRIVDHEAGDPDRAKDFLQSFEAHCEEAREDTLRKTFTPQVWGFGRGGYSYVGN